MNSTGEERPLRSRLVSVFVPLGLGLLFLVMSLSRPTIANMGFQELVRLLAAGGCLGAGLMAMGYEFGRRRKG
jgi:hypothetical protein